jgi:hypothetical protein
MDTNANQELVMQMFELFNQHEWEKMAALYAEPSEL